MNVNVFVVTRMGPLILTVWTLLLTAYVTTLFNYRLVEYIQCLHFQDYLIYENPLELVLPTKITFLVSFVWKLISICMCTHRHFIILSSFI